MTSDKKILYISVSLLLAILLVPMFMPVSDGRYLAAALLLLAAIVLSLLLKRRAIPSMYNREVLLIVSVISALYLVLIYVIGLSFGFATSPFPLGFENFFKYVLPITLIIVSSEIIRRVVLAYGDILSSVLCYVALAFGEILIHSTLQGIYSFNSFMDFVGLYMLPAFVSALLYHYIAKRYGPLPNIVYRIATTLYFYVIYYVPNIPDALFAAVDIIIPILIFVFIDALYEKKRKRALKKEGPLGYVLAGIALLLMTSLVMIISCQFRFGALVIATESMAGEINKGDAIVYEQLDDQKITEGQVIVFTKNKLKIVHRVDEIEIINNETRYYTKGDANDDRDLGYITSADIDGVVLFKVAYVGYPTLWLREIVSNALK